MDQRARELCTWVCCKGFSFSLTRSLPSPLETPPPHWAKFLNKASRVDRAWVVSIPFPAMVRKSIWGEEIQKLHNEKAEGAESDSEKAVRSRRVPALPQSHRCFPPGPGARRSSPGRSGVCVSGFPRKGLRSGSSRGDAGVGAAGAVTRRLAFFVDF